MILKFLRKVPAGMMIVPLLIGSFMNTFFPEALKIGSFTTATFSSAGAATAMGIQLFCLGTTLQLADMPKVVKRGGILLVSKFIIGAAIGIAVGKMFGFAGVCGLTTLAIISAVTNSNGSVYLALMKTYGDTTDCAAMALLALNDGPLLTLIALGASGLANVPFMALVATVIPIIVGMIIGNLDKSMRDFMAPAGDILIPFVGFTLGAGINLSNVLKGGVPGIVLGLISVFVGGAFIVFCDNRKKTRICRMGSSNNCWKCGGSSCSSRNNRPCLGSICRRSYNSSSSSCSSNSNLSSINDKLLGKKIWMSTT